MKHHLPCALLTVSCFFVASCTDEQKEVIKQLNNSPAPFTGLNNDSRLFQFNSDTELNEFKSFGEDFFGVSAGELNSPISRGKHGGISKEFLFAKTNTEKREPNEAEISFDVKLDNYFQKDGNPNETGKLFGFHGFYYKSKDGKIAGLGENKVTNEPNWSVRIAHSAQKSDGTVPLGLYIYYPGMPNNNGETIKIDNLSISTNESHNLKLYVKMNDLNRSNGVIRFTVDGTEVYNNSSWKLRQYKGTNIKAVWLDTYIGGKTPSQYFTSARYDNLSIKW